MDRREHTQATPALGATPTLARLLAGVGARLGRLIALHGVGTVALALAAWLVFAFFADFALHVPRGVRVFHLLVAIGVVAFFGWRDLVRPMLRRPRDAELAMLVERKHPELRELLVSAVELQRASPSGEPARVRDVLVAAEARAAELSGDGVLDARAPARRFGLGVLAVLGLALAAWTNPLYATIFLSRFFGGALAWPQRTTLEVSVPIADGRAKVETTAGEIRVRIARGTDVPVLVRAIGAIPDDVLLSFDDGTELSLPQSGDGAFRTLLRSVQEDFAFRATGGDDRDGEPRVSIEALEPPDVAALAVVIEPPAYSGLQRVVERDRDVQVLAGSRLSIRVLVEPQSARGVARLLPDDRVVELAAHPFPPQAESAPQEQGLGFDWVAERSLRYRFELEDGSGLSNPDPGLFAVEVVEDRAPEVELLAPARSEIETIQRGRLQLRVRAVDDFGVEAIHWRASRAGEDEPSIEGELELAAARDGATLERDADRKTAFASKRMQVGELLAPPAAIADGDVIVVELQATDNRPADAPAREGRAAQLRVRVIGEDEFMRRVQDRLTRQRVLATELEELVRGKHQRVQELVAAHGEGDEAGPSSNDLAAALSGARRIQGDAEGISRELAAIAESVLYAGIDDKAGALFERIDAALADARDREFQSNAWLELARAQKAGEIGAVNGIASELVSILGIALAISHEDARALTKEVERASQALDPAQAQAALALADQRHRELHAHVEELLSRLSEWDDFQSILSLTRDILKRQKTLLDRTRASTAEATGR